MSRQDHTFDFILLSPHGTGRGAMTLYLQQLDDVWLLSSEQYRKMNDMPKYCHAIQQNSLGLVIDRDYTVNKINFISEIVKSCIKDYSIIVTTRDPIAQLNSVTNVHLYWWALSACGASAIDVKGHHFFKSKSMDTMLIGLLKTNVFQFIEKILPLIASGAGNIIITDVNDLKPGSDKATMKKICNNIFNNSEMLYKTSPDTCIATLANQFFFRLHPLQYSDNHVTFSATPYPRQFAEFKKFGDPAAAAFYDPVDIGFCAGDFQGDLGFYFDRKGIAASGLPQAEFVSRARAVLERSGKEVVKEYSYDITKKLEKTAVVFSSLRLTPEKILELLPTNRELYDMVKESIQGQAEELAAAGSLVTDSWEYSREFLGGTLQRPKEQQYSHLRGLITALRQANAKAAADGERVARENAELQAGNSALRNENAALAADVAAHRKKTDSLAAENAAVRARLADLEKQRAALQSRLAVLAAAYAFPTALQQCVIALYAPFVRLYASSRAARNITQNCGRTRRIFLPRQSIPQMLSCARRYPSWDRRR